MGNEESSVPSNYKQPINQNSLDRMPELKLKSSLEMSLHHYELKENSPEREQKISGDYQDLGLGQRNFSLVSDCDLCDSSGPPANNYKDPHKKITINSIMKQIENQNLPLSREFKQSLNNDEMVKLFNSSSDNQIKQMFEKSNQIKIKIGGKEKCVRLNDMIGKEEVIKPGCQFSCYDIMSEITDIGHKKPECNEINISKGVRYG